MAYSNNIAIVDNPELFKYLVFAVNKAVTIDVPQAIIENSLETNNSLRFSTGDYINDNLRKYVVNDDVVLLPFRRHGWSGRILADVRNKITYSICSHNSLKNIVNTKRNHPHYNDSLLFVENFGFVSSKGQISLFDSNTEEMNSFDEFELLEDYDKIMQGSIHKEDGYTHLILAYTADHHIITKIELLLFNSEYTIIDKRNLIDYIINDYDSVIGGDFYSGNIVDEAPAQARPSLIRLRDSQNNNGGIVSEGS